MDGDGIFTWVNYLGCFMKGGKRSPPGRFNTGSNDSDSDS